MTFATAPAGPPTGSPLVIEGPPALRFSGVTISFR